MMVLVDTSAWVDFFRDQPGRHVDALAGLLEERQSLCTCGVILAEVLQGIRHDRHVARVRRLFDSLVFLPMDRPVYLEAAAIYRRARKKGTTIRKSIDCMIAATALAHRVPLLHHDRDFEAIAGHCPLTFHPKAP